MVHLSFMRLPAAWISALVLRPVSARGVARLHASGELGAAAVGNERELGAIPRAAGHHCDHGGTTPFTRA